VDTQAVRTYTQNFDTTSEAALGDIRSVKQFPVHINLLVGGVPCQSWSIAGKNRGFDDPRGALWGDTVRLVESTQPDAFVFENVKGLADPRHTTERTHLLRCFAEAGYAVWMGVLDSQHFGLPQSRKRIYFVGMRTESQKRAFARHFRLLGAHEFAPSHIYPSPSLAHVLGLDLRTEHVPRPPQADLFGETSDRVTSTRVTGGAFDYVIFNDIRNGHATVHSWDLADVSPVEQRICQTLLENRRNRCYGPRDGNPLTREHLADLLPDLSRAALNDAVDRLTDRRILWDVRYDALEERKLEDDEPALLGHPAEHRIEFVNSRISSGIRVSDYLAAPAAEDIVYRIFLPDATAFGTLTASGSKDFVALETLRGVSPVDFKRTFVERIVRPRHYRALTPREHARLQGFPDTFAIHPSPSVSNRQMGNAVSVPVIRALGQLLLDVGAVGGMYNASGLRSKVSAMNA